MKEIELGTGGAVPDDPGAQPLSDCPSVTVAYRIPFYDTDAMGVVHHANYLRYLELARTYFLERFDRPYTEYMEEGVHAAVTRVDARYLQAIRFNDDIRITCWLEWVKTVKLCFHYRLHKDGQLVASALTEHVMINGEGKAIRLSKQWRSLMNPLALNAKSVAIEAGSGNAEGL